MQNERTRPALNRNPLDLVERDFVTGPIVELGGARAFVRGHGLGVFERAASLEVGSDAGCAEHVAAELDLEAGLGRAPADHAIGVDTVHRLVRQHAGLADRRAEEGGLAVLADAGCGEILISELFELMRY
jgi:hypothetical protein